ncbi:unnamed protein product [Prorocentrum cordatum]|uniref:Protein kinase domain-containing protein n=1 Tax=Prorocentrum cordatum TaxID=2364126 RepID=A0ABN9XE48_9DINO|nr:unnamed protein product [Polarella glacialis]
MRCFDSFATRDDAGEEYWCLILEWLDASLYDVVRANGNRGLHLAMVRVMLSQLLEQLSVLQEFDCTHTDIKHKNCCLADTRHFLLPASDRGRGTMILARPHAKLIDYGNAVFEGDRKAHPIHTKQFRAPEVLLNAAQGWGPPSDVWTLGVTAAFLLSGRLLFNSHEPGELVRAMADALGPFPAALLAGARDGRARRAAEQASAAARDPPRLAEQLGLGGFGEGTPEAACADLVRRMLSLDPAERIDAKAALRHPFLAAGLPALPQRPRGAELRALRPSAPPAASASAPAAPEPAAPLTAAAGEGAARGEVSPRRSRLTRPGQSPAPAEKDALSATGPRVLHHSSGAFPRECLWVGGSGREV